LAIAAALLDCPDLGDGRPHEEVVWMVGAVPAAWHRRATRQSAVLRDSGYVVSRTSRGDHLVFDVGPLGYLNAGHAHADALSVTLSVAGQPLLIDPGTGGYTIDRTLRDRFRSTAAHNTIVLDGRWQSAPSGPFHWHSRAAVRLETCQLERDCDFIEATHDGYDAFIHRRQVLSRPGCWIVVDWLSGDRESPIAAHWHLDPAWRIGSMEPGRTALVHASGTTVWMLTSVPDVETRVSGDDGLGWWAPVYGAIEPTTTLRVPVTASTPHALITVFVEDLAARLQLPADWSPQGPTPEPIAFRVVATGWEDTVVAAGPTVATVEGAKYGLSGRGRLLCARASVPLGAAVLAAAR
jgi:hypothetical protein